MIIGRIEISQNFEYLITLPGFSKLLTVIFGIIALGLGGYSYEAQLSFWKEDFFLDVVSIFGAISFFYLLAHSISDDLVIHPINKIVDIVYHAVGCMSLIMAGIVMLYSAVHIEKNECKYTGARHYCQYFDEKIGAGTFSILNGILYCTTAVLVYKVKGL